MQDSKKTYGYFGHHKCASTWIENICYLLCHDLGLKMKVFYDPSMFDNNLPVYVKKHNIDFIVYANADYKHVEDLQGLVGFHVVRDPRDIVVSAYFSHLKTHPTNAWPELVKYREKLQACSKEEGLFLEIEFRRNQFEEMMSWPENNTKNIFLVKMEDMILEPYEQVLSIFSELGLIDESYFSASKRIQFIITKIFRKIEKASSIKISGMCHQLPVERLLGIVWENDFKKISGGRKLGQENQKSHYRKGVAGDWINHLNESHKKRMFDNYAGVLSKYDYQ